MMFEELLVQMGTALFKYIHTSEKKYQVQQVILLEGGGSCQAERAVIAIKASELIGWTSLPAEAAIIIVEDTVIDDTAHRLLSKAEGGYAVCGEEQNLRELYHRALEVLRIAHRVDSAYARMSRCMLRKMSVKAILKAAETEIGNPVFLSDTSTKVLEYSNMEALERVEDELIRCILQYGFVTSDYFDKYNYPSLLDSIEDSSQAFYLKSEYETKKDRILVKLTVNGMFFGWLAAYPLYRDFEKGDCQIMDVLAELISMELERNKYGFALSYRENLLMELLAGNISSQEEFERRARGFDWKLEGHYYVVVIGLCGQETQQEQTRSIIAYKNHLALIFPTVKSICLGDSLALLLETRELEAYTSVLDHFLKRYHLLAGVSSAFTDILLFGKHCRQAEELLALGKRLKPEKQVVTYRDLYPYYSIWQIGGPEELYSACLPEIRVLWESNTESARAHLETLRAYVQCKNAALAAEHLHIHRNTMNYRLQRVEAQTGLSLSDTQTLHHIWFSLQILDLLNLKKIGNFNKN